MITVKLQGGLGNQMFEYAAGRALALKQNSPLELDTSWYAKSDNRNFELDSLNISKEVAINSKKLYWWNLLGLNTSQILDGYHQGEKYFKDITPIIKKEFTLKHPLSAEAKKWAEKISAAESVSIHIRRGDYLWEKHKKIHGILPVEYYRQAADIIETKTAKPVFFVFSDDIIWAKDNLKLPRPTEFVSDIKISAPEEMGLMSLCKHNIIANSTFSWWGAWLNQNHEKIVVAPKNWFADAKRNPDEIIPQTWLRI